MKTPHTVLRSGFTLIELLVVIAIIGVLSSVVLVSLDQARAKARDTRRTSDIRTLQTALALYYNDHGRYPEGVATPDASNWEASYGREGKFIDELVEGGYLPSHVVDPINNSTYRYRYHRYSAGYAGCDISRGRYYVLLVENFETVNGRHPDSPGWVCPERDWHTQGTSSGAAWVVGEFEQ